MAKDTTEQQKRMIAAQGYGPSGKVWDKGKRVKYWTPDGREIIALPSVRGFIRKDKDGKVIETGTRDANLDKGWLLAPPTDPKVRCTHCDKWHDTQEEVDGCGASTRAFISHKAQQVKKEFGIDEPVSRKEFEELKGGLDEIKQLLTEVLKHG